MPRQTKLWTGKSDDAPIPPRVRLRVFLKHDGRCQLCQRKINTGERWVCDHIVALINSGANAESNLQPICNWCDKKIKTPADVAEKSKTYRKRLAHAGIKKTRQPIPGGRGTKWKHTFSRGWVKR